MGVDRIGYAEIALGIFEIDGVDLVGHSAGAYLARLDPLFEILHRNIGPHVPAEVDQNGVDPLQGIEYGRQIVVVLDLGRVLRTVQSERTVDETVGEGHPVDTGIGRAVGVEVARSTAELGRHGQRVQLGDLLLQPLHVDHQLLAQPGRRGGLSVGAGQHGHVVPLGREVTQASLHLLQSRIEHLAQTLLQREGDRGVVDILRGEPEMDELLAGAQADFVHLLLEQVLDGLHVVVGDRFDLLHAAGVVRREVAVERAQLFERRRIDLRQLGQRQFAQSDEILHLHADAVADERRLGEIVGQFFGFAAIAAVDG